MSRDDRLPPPTLNELGEQACQLAGMIEQADKAGSFPFKTKDEEGNLIGMFRVLVYSPQLGESITRIGLAIDTSDQVPRRARHAAILAVAAHEQSDYEWYSHELAAQDSLTPDEIEGLRQRKSLRFGDNNEQVCHDVVRSLLDIGDVPDELHVRAVDALGHSGLVELVWIVGLYKASALQLRVHRLGAPTTDEPLL